MRVVLMVCGLSLLLLAGCSRRAPEATAPGQAPDAAGEALEEKVVVYSPHGKEMEQEFEHRFEATHPGVDVQILDMGSQSIMDRLRSERENPQCDLWWGAPSTMFMQAADEGLLAVYQPTWREQVESEYHDPQDRWYGTFLTLEVIAFNRDRLTREEAPQDWDDLLAPKWRGQILLRDPMPSGTMRTIFSAMIWRFYSEQGRPDEGYEWLKQLDANTKAYAASPIDMLQRLATGEGLITVWNLTDILQQQHLYQLPLDYLMPASGTPVVTEGIALTANAPHPEAARAFYEFVTTQDALRAQAEAPYFRYPARRDIDLDSLPEWVRSLEFKPLPVDWQVFAEKQEEWMKHWDQQIRDRGR